MGGQAKNPLGKIKVKTPNVTSASSKTKEGAIVKNVTSTNIKRYAYDKTKRLLTVEFLNGRIYEYRGVNEILFTGLNRAKSKGKYFGAHIRSRQNNEVKATRAFIVNK